MTKHYNPSIAIRANRILNSRGTDFLPDDVNGPTATIELQPNISVLGSTSKTTSGAATIFTSETSRDTYITAIDLSFIKDATCDTASGGITVTYLSGGATVTVCRQACLTLTAQSTDTFFIFGKRGLRVDRGTAISLGGNTFTVGSLIRTCVVYGFTEETQQNQ